MTCGRSSLSRGLLGLLVALVVSGLLASCGGSKSSVERGASPPSAGRLASASADKARRASKVHIPTTPEQAKASGVPCVKANAWLGRVPGAIDFAVRCLSGRAGSTNFSIGRDPRRLGGDPRSGIHTFRHRLPVTGPGRVTQRYRHCARDRDSVRCWARVQGAVRIAGRLWVSPESRCQKIVGIASYGENGINLLVARLFVGLPRGCP